MKQLTFSVTLKFSDSIETNEDIKEVMQNVMSALFNQADTAGIAPDDSDFYTTNIIVSEPYFETRIEKNLI